MSGKSSLVLALSAFLVLSACSAAYNRQDTGGAEFSGVTLDKAKAVLIAIPADGAYGGKPYLGSGQMVAQQVAAAFARYAQKVDMAPSNAADRTALVDAAKKGGFGYIVMPVIAHWEHRATAWSGIPSRASVGVSVLDGQTGDKLQSSSLEGRSRIVSWTSTSPESLLPDMITGYVNALYGR